MKRFFQYVSLISTLCCGFLLGVVGYLDYTLPDNFAVSRGEDFHIGRLVESAPASEKDTLPAAALKEGDSYRAVLRLGNMVPLKEVTMTVAEAPVVMVCGTPFGIKLYTEGVLVVGMSDVDTAMGKANPAAAAGVRVGDTILSINGQAVSTNREVSRLVNGCEGRSLRLLLRRDGVDFEAEFTPVRPRDEKGYRAGLWVRDSTAGVGILTFYNADTGVFGGLGHAVCDVDTGEQMSISDGEIVPARIFDVTPGEAGAPGELCGTFLSGSLGKLEMNTAMGLYGRLTAYPLGALSLPIARWRQVETGSAQILTTVDGTAPAWYDVEIRQIRKRTSSEGRHMVVEITDAALLEKTGGIVQGMSGSPLIQNGRLVGAVTHVLVDDPTKGYAIFAETMLETAQGVANEQLKEVS